MVVFSYFCFLYAVHLNSLNVSLLLVLASDAVIVLLVAVVAVVVEIVDFGVVIF